VRYDLIIFDCDGVLVDSESIVIRVFVEMLGELGYTLDHDRALREFTGTSMVAKLEFMRERLALSVPPKFSGDFTKRLAEEMERDLKPVPGILEALSAISRPWCVASNGSHEGMRQRLRLTGLIAYFEPYLFSALDVAHAKPAPDVYLHAAASMGVAAPRSAVVEDSVIGVEAGVRAGMTVFGYARITDSEALRRAGARVFQDISQLPALLQSPDASLGGRNP
jgi:HAD superfamily hydrolase (TIGR01509 family)